ncbi:hypothetical protein [Alicyclobacillus mengziensis]|uniref:Uncharacterized protein n=1 Tax=Alicyclobacillus mengziensis TaxID=2931921 RepID=A0A9X7Z682_9BACL|nr:hypothetical protein [Alicyclobacillus mengziensis]QSO45948.1 hypothetical protein JZ786_15565 [Alicyclobacillus mengziensis]
MAHTGTESGGCQLIKRLETGLVVAIGALTVLTTATVIHDENAGNSDVVSRWVDSGMKRVETWVTTRAVPAVTGNVSGASGADGTSNSTGSSSSSSPSSRPTSGSAKPTSYTNPVGAGTHAPYPEPMSTLPATHKGAPQAPAQVSSQLQARGFTAADVATLTNILTQLASSMSPSDWTTLEQAFASSSTSQAQQQVLRVLNSHLTSSDRAWLLSHFQGNMAFSKEDIQLLQQAFAELKDNLTPGEQQLVQQQVGQLLTSGQASAN